MMKTKKAIIDKCLKTFEAKCKGYGIYGWFSEKYFAFINWITILYYYVIIVILLLLLLLLKPTRYMLRLYDQFGHTKANFSLVQIT